ncbi:MAG: hypothetical protein PWP09_373 [Thermotogota bacterium]|nr:hypothetical protein [Thermotogota bacterium]
MYTSIKSNRTASYVPSYVFRKYSATFLILLNLEGSSLDRGRILWEVPPFTSTKTSVRDFLAIMSSSPNLVAKFLAIILKPLDLR